MAGGGEKGRPSVPLSIPSGEHTVWVDVSSLIADACEDLQDGKLVHGQNFSLFAAMSALEIMDPKMDSGIEGNGYWSTEEAIENGAAPIPLSPTRSLNVQCVIDVMDHLLACEATWHKGHSLAQTVFSCIYLLRIERTSSEWLLHPYLRVIRSTCNVVVSAVSDARTHEEEDLFTMAYGLNLRGDGDEKCLSLLSSVEETISRNLRACSAQPSKRKMLEANLESLQDNPDLEDGFCRSLLCRIRFRKHLYHVLLSLRKPQGRGSALARKHIASCLHELGLMYKSQEFLQSNMGRCQENVEERTTASGRQAIGFDVTLNTRLSAPTPTRAIQLLSWKKAVKYFEKLLHDLDLICSFTLDPTLESVLNFIVHFQKSQPDLVARAHLQLLLVQDGKLYGRDFFYDVISRVIDLPEFATDQEFQKNEFVVQLCQLVVNLLKVLCTNTAWQRRKLGKILQDWSVFSMQLEMALKREFGDMLDTVIEENACAKVSQYLLFWAEEQTYWIAARFLMLGFELELYSLHEYCMVYWYLYIVFMKLLEKMHLRTNSKIDSSRRKARRKKEAVSKDILRDTTPSASCMLVKCFMYLSEGLAMTLAALRNESNDFKVPSIFNGEEERFCQHFDLLQKAQVPDYISYNLFHETTRNASISSIAKYNNFREVQRIASSLRGSFSGDPARLQELRRIEQVAEHNRIAVNIINQIAPRDTNLRISFELSHHPSFAVAVVKR